MSIHARHVPQIQSCTHTSLSLFNHWLYYRGYFPRQCLWRRWARQAEWEGEISLSLITWKPQYWHSHWLRWMNLIYLPFEAQMTSWYGFLSLSQEAFIFLLRPWNLEIHRKTSDGILTETNLFCGPTRLVCIFVHIEAATFSPQPFYDHQILLIIGVYVCVQPWLFIAGAESCVFMPGRNTVLSLIAAAAYGVIMWSDIKIRGIICFLV